MLDFWLRSCQHLLKEPSDFYAGARKIIRGVKLTYKPPSTFFTKPSLVMADCGFTKSKMSMLRRNYYVEDSIKAAVELWDERLSKDKYGSVGFHCYNHFKKGNIGNFTKYGSTMGPCINAVNLTFEKGGGRRRTYVDLYYRTTELFKKWPADLVFMRDELLPNFNFKNAPIENITFHFANVSLTAMYAVTIMPHLPDPVAWLDGIKKYDSKFYPIVLKWIGRYTCKEHETGILNHQQSLRTRKDALERLSRDQLRELQKYIRAHYKKGARDIEDDEGDE